MSIGEKETFWEFISSPEIKRIEIPAIQRDYIQGRHTPQVEYSRKRLLDDIRNAIETGISLDLNFVYGKDENAVFIPIDGQQRLTTLLSLHIYAFAKEKKNDELTVLKRKFKYLTRASTRRFLDDLIDNISDFFFDQTTDDIGFFIKDSSWYSTEWDKDPSVNSFIVVLSDIHERFESIHDLSEKLCSNCSVSFMALKITDIGNSNDLYIKMNSRGKALTEFERFKSELFNYLEANGNGIDTSDFKKKSDNEWLNMIWKLCKNPEKECDAVYMSFLHRIIMNRLTADKSKNLNNLDNNVFYNFADYKPYLDGNGKAIRDVYATLKLCVWLFDNIPEKEAKTIKALIRKAGKSEFCDRMQIVALTKYAIDVSEDLWSADSWNAWNRVITNLIKNTEIDNERFSRTANSIYSMDASAPVNAHDYFADISANQIKFFNRAQVEEEILKCQLIKLDHNWLETFAAAEANSYFCGEIRFALSLSNITNVDSSADQQTARNNFSETWRIINLIFDSSSSNSSKLRVDDSLFRRGLLTYGDYSIWAGSSYTLFFEGGHGYFNWRRMLREKLSVFRSLFNELKDRNVATSSDVEAVLNAAIEGFHDRSDELRYYMVKVPGVLAFMREKRFRRSADDTKNGRNILYSGARLSANYAEAYSYAAFCLLPGTDNEYHYGRGNLYSNTTLAYIEKINGKSVYIKYNYSQKYYCNKNDSPLKNKSGNIIKTVDDLLANLDDLLANFKS